MKNRLQPLSAVIFFCLFVSYLQTPFAFAEIPTQWKTAVDAGVKNLQEAELFVSAEVGFAQGDSSAIWNYGKTKESSVFEIGSITKVFTGIVLAQLAIEGKVTLDAKVETYLPEFKQTYIGAITLRELALHQSGLPRMPCRDRKVTYCFHPKDPANPYADFAWMQLKLFLLNYTPKGYSEKKPKPKYPRVYSNIGYGLLGYLLVQVDQAPDFDDMVKRRITSILGMNDTAVKLSADQQARFVPGHDVAHVPTSHWDQDVMAPGGGLHSTATDMMKFLQTCLDPEMITFRPGTKTLGQAMLMSQKEGLGWDSAPEASLVYKNGQTGGFDALLRFDKSKKLGSFVMFNMAFADPAEKILDLPFQNTKLPDLKGVFLNDLQMAFVGGTYDCKKNDMEITISRLGNYLILISDGERAPLRARSPSKFDLVDGFLPIGWNKISVNRDFTGAVKSITFHQKDLNGKKVGDFFCRKKI